MKTLFYYNAHEDIWQNNPCLQDSIEFRLNQLRIHDTRFSYVYLPMIWSVELLPNRIVEVILHTKCLTLQNHNITNAVDKEWTIDCDFDNSMVQGWPISLVRKAERYWRNGYVCGANISFPELLAATYVDIPAAVVDLAIEYLKYIAKDKFGFFPSYLGNSHGLFHMIAFCECPLDPNIYILRDVLGNEPYRKILKNVNFDCYKELCNVLEIKNPPPSLRRAYVINPESILIYLYFRQCGFHDINIIRRFFYREEIFSYKLLKMKYDYQLRILRNVGYDLNNFQIYCRWLLRYRSEKDIAPRVLRWCNDGFNNVASDTLRMFVAVHIDENEDLINHALRRQLLNEGLSQEIHDTLVEELFITHPDVVDHFNMWNDKKYENVSYKYRNKELSLENVVEGYSFNLPKETKELRKFGNVFHNCVASYNSAIIRKESLIFVMKKQEKYVACIEIRQGRITQALGHCNQKLDMKYRNIIKIWAKKNNIIYGHL